MSLPDRQTRGVASQVGAWSTGKRRGTRPVDEADLPRVAGLLDRLLPSASGRALPHRAATLRRLLLEHPWQELSIPPLVYELDGVVVGFLGAHPRPMVWQGRRLRAVWCGPLVTDPDAGVPAGPLLLKALLGGPQDATLSDGGNPVARQLWERFRGRVSHVRCLSWWRVLRPWRGIGELWGRHRGTELGRVGGGLLDGLDRVTPRTAGFRPPEPAAATSLLEPSEFVELRGDSDDAEPRVDYDTASATWLLRELGAMRRQVVLDGDGAPIGWYVAQLPRRGVGRVLGMGAVAGRTDLVLHSLLRDASDRGAAALTGRVEPNLLEPLLGVGRPLFNPGPRVLVHARDDRLADVLVGGEGDLTRLDGEWWVLPHLQLPRVDGEEAR